VKAKERGGQRGGRGRKDGDKDWLWEEQDGGEYMYSRLARVVNAGLPHWGNAVHVQTIKQQPDNLLSLRFRQRPL
jgi:hypothetical protein